MRPRPRFFLFSLLFAAFVPASPAGDAQVLVSPAIFRIPSPAWLHEGDTLTASIAASVEENGVTRPARPEEISGVVKLGEWAPGQGIVNEMTQPVGNGRFVLGGLPAGQRILRFFLGDGIGAEVARIQLVVSPGKPAPADGFAAPFLAPEGSDVLVTGPFRGDEEAAKLTVGGRPARLVWATSSAALFALPDVPPGRNELVLSRAGQPALRSGLSVFTVTFTPPQPPEISMGEYAVIEVHIEGLPPSPRAHGADPWPARAGSRPVLTLVWRNESPDVVHRVRPRGMGGREDGGELFVPIPMKSMTADGTVVVTARAYGKSKGPVDLPGRFVVEDDLLRPVVPLVSSP